MSASLNKQTKFIQRNKYLLVRLHHVSQPEQTDKIHTTELASLGVFVLKKYSENI